MADHADVLILGGGVIGLTTAYFLAREGVRVAVIDKGDFGREASWAGAGIIPPAGEPRRARRRSTVSVPSAPPCIPTCRAGCASRPASTTATTSAAGWSWWNRRSALPVEEWRGEGIAFRELEGDALRAVEPALSPALPRAYHLPDMAQVRNPRHLKALVAACRAQGVGLHPHRGATGFVRTGRRIDAVQTEQGPLSGGTIPRGDGRLDRRPAGTGRLAARRPPGARPDRPAQDRRRAAASRLASGQALPRAARRRPGAGRLDGGGRRLRRPADGRRDRRAAGLRRRTGPVAGRGGRWNAAGRACGPAVPTACRSSAPCPAAPISSSRPATSAPASSCRRRRAWS